MTDSRNTTDGADMVMKSEEEWEKHMLNRLEQDATRMIESIAEARRSVGFHPSMAWGAVKRNIVDVQRTGSRLRAGYFKYLENTSDKR